MPSWERTHPCVQPTQDGQKLAMIPLLPNKKLLMIKLRDFPQGEGLFINGFSFSNSVKGMNKVVSPNGQGQRLNQPAQPNQNQYPSQNQPNTQKVAPSNKGKKKQN